MVTAVDKDFRVKNGLSVVSTATILSTAISNSTSTGALQVAGGVGIGGKLYVGGLANNTSSYIVYINTATGELSYGVNSGGSGIASPYGGIFTVTNTTAASSTNTGALQVVGGVGIGGNLYTGGLVNASQTVRTDRFLQSPYQSVAPRGLVYQGTGVLSTITTAIALSNSAVLPSIAIDPTGRFAYVTVVTDNTVNQFSINTTTGALTSITPATTATGSFPKSITITPNGRFAYVVNVSGNTVSQYSINTSTGALTSITPATTTTGSGPRSMAVDPTGRFAYVANETDSTINQYSINTITGALSAITPTIAVGSYPQWIVIDPTGRFVYTGNQIGNSISQLAINQNTGALSTITTAVAIGAAAVYMAIDPTGRFVYVTTNNTKIVQCSINQNSGALSIISTSSHSTIMNGLGVDPSGRFLYVINFDNTVSQYSIDQSTGEIRLLGIVIGTSPNPFFLAIDPTARFMYIACDTVVNQYSINNFSAGSGTISGTLNIASTATSVSTTTGALTIAGGVGIGGKLYVGGLANNTSSYIVYINTATGELSYGINSGGSSGLSSPYSGIFTITNTSNSISTTTGALQVVGGVAINRDLYVGGTITIAGNAGGDIDLAGGDILNVGRIIASTGTFTTITVTSITSATSTTTGALQVRGGVGVGGKLFVGGLANSTSSYIVYINTATGELSYGINSGGSSGGSLSSPYSGIFTITNTTSATSTITGALQVVGGVGIGGNLYANKIYANGTQLLPTSIQEFTASAGQTTFTVSGGYASGQILVYANGVLLGTSDYTASDNSTVVLSPARRVNDLIKVVVGQNYDVSAQQAYIFTEVVASTSGQTSFTANYNTATVQVFVDGVLRSPTAYTATNGTTIVLASGSGIVNGTRIGILSFNSVSISGALSLSGGTINGSLNVTGSIQKNGVDITALNIAMSVALGI